MKLYYPSITRAITLCKKSFKLATFLGLALTLFALSDDDLCMIATGICISQYLGYYLYNKGIDNVIKNKEKFYINRYSYIVIVANYIAHFLLYLAYILSFITLLYVVLWSKEFLQGTLDMYNKVKIFEVLGVSLLVILYIYAEVFFITFKRGQITIKDYEGVAWALMNYLNNTNKVEMVLNKRYNDIYKYLIDTQDYDFIARVLLGIQNDNEIIWTENKDIRHNVRNRLDNRDDTFKERGPRDI